MNNLLKKLIAECIGTFVLVFCACGVAAFTHGDLASTSLAFGLVIVAMAYSIGRISGCHINPAVSLGCLIAKKMTFKEFILYVCAQIVGGFLGALLLFGVCKMADIHLAGDACNAIVGGYANGFTAGGTIGAILVEIVLTFIFVYVILNVTDDKGGEGEDRKGISNLAGIIIGLTLVLVHLIGINLTGTSVNPARSIATALGALIFNGTTDALAQVWIFIVAPLAGAALAALSFRFLHSEKSE